MWSFIQSSIILFILSIIILFLLHHLIEYLKNTYTTRKTKDVVGTQIQKYKQMMDDLYKKKEKQWMESSLHDQFSGYDIQTNPHINPLSEKELQSVNNDLDEFITPFLSAPVSAQVYENAPFS